MGLKDLKSYGLQYSSCQVVRISANNFIFELDTEFSDVNYIFVNQIRMSESSVPTMSDIPQVLNSSSM